MPATRRSRNTTSAAKTQNRLPFNTKVTKPAATSGASGKEKLNHLSAPTSKSISVPKTVEISAAPAEDEQRLQQQQQHRHQQPERTEEEQQALRVSDAQIKRYWRAKEAERIAPRVHQRELSVEEKVLREWDVCSHFGSCVGIPRKRRWVRASKLGLNPPIEVLAVLLRQEDKGLAGTGRAYLDELMGSKAGLGEV